MTVNQIISLIKKQNPEWTDADILSLLNYFQEMVLKTNNQNNLVYDTTTGDLPYLATSANTFIYSMPATYYNVEYIVIKDPIFANNPAFAIHSDNSYKFPSDTIHLGNRTYHPVPIVHKPALGPTGVCTVMFRDFDPGTTTNLYQIYGYQYTNAITSKNSVLNIPDKFHLSCVIPAIQTIIDGLDNGSYEDSNAKILGLYLPPIWADMNWNSIEECNVKPQGI